MSFYLGAALQLFGRPWDKLYHVLVTPEFESRPEFFYKPRKNKVIEWKTPDGSVKRLNTNDAEIILAELPFIRLRAKLDLRGKGFEELVAEGQSEIDTATVQPELTVSLRERTIRIGSRVMDLVPVQIMLYTAFVRQKLVFCKWPDRSYCADCTDCFQTPKQMVSPPALALMADNYAAVYGSSPGKASELLEHWKGSDGVKAVTMNRSKLNRAIGESGLDTTLVPYYAITSVRQYGDTRYGLRAEKGKMRVE